MARGLKGVVYQTGPDGVTHAFARGTTKAKLPDWVVVDDGAFEDLAGVDGDPQQPTGDSDDQGDGGAGEPLTGDYDSHTVAELQAEIDRRNADLPEDGQITVGGKGNKPDLVEALNAADAAAQA